jgi:hypothetical protein
MQDGELRRGSGLRIGGRFVLTADHCVNGTDHQVIVNGQTYPAAVHVQSGTRDIDLAVLSVPDLSPLESLECAQVDRSVVKDLQRCRALGFPIWKIDSRLAQVYGEVPTAEGLDPNATLGARSPLSLKITNQQIRETPKSQWLGMSGAVVVTPEDLILGVVRSHSPAEGVGSLTFTGLDAITDLPIDKADLFLSALHIWDIGHLRKLPVQVDRTAARLERIRQLIDSGAIYQETAIRLQAKVVELEWI